MDPIITPKISVLMPVYNCRPFIEESVNSILNQTFADFEFLIIDDCSTDGTYEFLQSLTDARIKLIRKEENSGISESLNMGIDLARGEYIARMDGDDISLVTRFEEQFQIMSMNSEMVVCGSWLKILGTEKVYQNPETHEKILFSLLKSNPIAHPSVMFRKSVLASLKYDKTKEPAEDYELWTRLVFEGGFYNIQKPLLIYRQHEAAISCRNAKIQFQQYLYARIQLYKKLNYNNLIYTDDLLMKYFVSDTAMTTKQFKLIMQWVFELSNLNSATNIFPQLEFTKLINKSLNRFIKDFFEVHKFSLKGFACLTLLSRRQLAIVLKLYYNSFIPR
ncbi:MAG: glycosyltransferase [Bacteroidetes bacterium]|nr:glycosyltransferase [Bacteroidota bacterium]